MLDNKKITSFSIIQKKKLIIRLLHGKGAGLREMSQRENTELSVNNYDLFFKFFLWNDLAEKEDRQWIFHAFLHIVSFSIQNATVFHQLHQFSVRRDNSFLCSTASMIFTFLSHGKKSHVRGNLHKQEVGRDMKFCQPAILRFNELVDDVSGSKIDV